MKGDRKKLSECFLWVVLFLVCAIISVFYMVKEPNSETVDINATTEMITEATTETTTETIIEASTSEEVSTTEEPTTERAEQLNEDVPSGTIQ